MLTVYGANFGPPTLYDAKTRYIGPVGNFPREKYTPPEAVVVLPGGAHVACLKTLHVSDSEVLPISQFHIETLMICPFGSRKSTQNDLH